MIFTSWFIKQRKNIQIIYFWKAIAFGKEYNSQCAYSQEIEYENLDGFWILNLLKPTTKPFQ